MTLLNTLIMAGVCVYMCVRDKITSLSLWKKEAERAGETPWGAGSLCLWKCCRIRCPVLYLYEKCQECTGPNAHSLTSKGSQPRK